MHPITDLFQRTREEIVFIDFSIENKESKGSSLGVNIAYILHGTIFSFILCEPFSRILETL